MLLSACGKEEECDTGYYYNVDLSSDVISCDYGESRTFVIKSEDDFYVSAVKLYDATGSSCKMQNSDETFSMITDQAISDQYDSPLPYTVSGSGYSIAQSDNHTIQSLLIRK